MEKIYYELEGNEYNGDNITLCSGTKRQCLNAFKKMSEEQKAKYYFISLQPYSEDERLDFDETLYMNSEVIK